MPSGVDHTHTTEIVGSTFSHSNCRFPTQHPLKARVPSEFLHPLIGSDTMTSDWFNLMGGLSFIYDVGRYRTIIENTLSKHTFQEKLDFIRLFQPTLLCRVAWFQSGFTITRETYSDACTLSILKVVFWSHIWLKSAWSYM